MRRLLVLAIPLLTFTIAYGEDAQEPVKVCVPLLQNSSREIVNPTWQRNQLITAFVRINRSKDVKKGKLARVEATALDSTTAPDPNVREKDCRFILRTNLIEAARVGTAQVSVPPPGALEVGTRVGDSRAIPPDYHTLTIEYRLIRAGETESWSSGMVTAQAEQSEDTLASQLMDQIANRVASDLRKPRPTSPR